MKKIEIEAMVETETEKFKAGMLFGAMNHKASGRQLVSAMLEGKTPGVPKVSHSDARKLSRMFREMADAIDEEVGAEED